MNWLDLLVPRDAAELRNVGRGVAVNVMLTSADGRWVTLIDTLRPDETSAVSRNDLQDDDGFYAYYQDLTGRWFYTRAVYQGLVWADGLDIANTFRGRIRGRRIPRPARRELRRTSETSWDYYRAVSSYLTLRGWALRARNAWIAIRIDLPRWLAGIPDTRRQERFAGRYDTVALAPAAEARSAWPIDLTYDIACWKGPRHAGKQERSSAAEVRALHLQIAPEITCCLRAAQNGTAPYQLALLIYLLRATLWLELSIRRSIRSLRDDSSTTNLTRHTGPIGPPSPPLRGQKRDFLRI